MWAVVLEELLVLLHGDSTVKDSRLDRRKILAETLVLVGNLKGQLTSVTKYQDGDLFFFDIDLLKGGQDKDGSLSHTGLGLTDNISSKNSLRDGLVLNFTWVLKTSINDGSQKLWLQQEILETRGMNTDVVASESDSKSIMVTKVVKITMRYSSRFQWC